MIVKIFVVSILFCFSLALAPDFNDQIANEIFSSSKPSAKIDEVYMVLVTDSTNQQISKRFQQYCAQRTNCTILDTSNSHYKHIISFIGYEGNNYCLIIDAHHHLKYIQPIDTTHAQSQYDLLAATLSNFQTEFQSGSLSPFFASEDFEYPNKNEQCMKLTGRTYQQFLVEDQPVKIVYLYTESSFCEACEEYLSQFKSIAQKYFERNVIRFGFIDVLKNDNKFIKDEIIPYFLIYIRDNFDDPYGVGADQFEQLQQYVEKLIEDVKESRYTSDMAQNDEEL